MKKVIIACDSFKESMSAETACRAVEKGIKAINESVNCLLVPMADGGEGTVDVLMNTLLAKYHFVDVKDPLGRLITAKYGMNNEGTAIMECASSCGLDLIERDQRNPTVQLSCGLGEMMKDAILKGAKKIIIGLGGSATNDGGFGMLYALGGRFYDESNHLLPASMESILKIKSIDFTDVYHLLNKVEIIVANDVENYYTGPLGATYVFGKQKGANKQQLEYLENNLLHLQSIFLKTHHIDLSQIKKTGAAGGLGGALYLLGAKMMNGIDMVLEINNFANKIQNVDYIVTGEGSIDFQTINGKTISGIAKIAKKYNVPVLAFAGRVTPDATNLYDIGVTSMFSITNEAKTLKQALQDGESSLSLCVENVFRLIETCKKEEK